MRSRRSRRSMRLCLQRRRAGKTHTQSSETVYARSRPDLSMTYWSSLPGGGSSSSLSFSVLLRPGPGAVRAPLPTLCRLPPRALAWVFGTLDVALEARGMAAPALKPPPPAAPSPSALALVMGLVGGGILLGGALHASVHGEGQGRELGASTPLAVARHGCACQQTGNLWYVWPDPLTRAPPRNRRIEAIAPRGPSRLPTCHQQCR